MKKLNLLVSVLMFVQFTFAQDSLKNVRNEINLDATNLFKQFLNLNNSQSSYPYFSDPAYYVGYKRHFDKFSLRADIGGNYSIEPITGTAIPDSIQMFQYKNKSIALNFGVEHYSKINKKFEAYFGFNFRYSKANLINESYISNPNYVVGKNTETSSIGFCPSLGFKFNINHRFAIQTETFFCYYLETQIGRAHV